MSPELYSLLMNLARASAGRTGKKAFTIMDIMEERESQLRAMSRATKSGPSHVLTTMFY